MNFLLIISILSMVLQNSILNHAGKTILKTKKDIYNFNTFMYLICFIAYLFFALSTGISLYTVLLGVVFGLVTNLSNVFKIRALATGPMHITILITTASMIIPTISGAIFFNEAFSIAKLIALILLVLFIFFASKQDDGMVANKKWIIYCISTFLFMGIIGVLQKIHQNSSHKNELFAFLTVAFLCSLIFAFVLSKKEKAETKINKKQIIFALLCGVCTFTMNVINLKLSGIMPSQVFFPLVNGSSIILSSLMSLFFFKEKADKRQIICLIGGIISLIGICIL